jgi:TolA-binding protein
MRLGLYIFAAAWLSCATAAAAVEAPAAPQEQAQMTPCAKQALRAQKYLSAALEKQQTLEPKQLNRLTKDLEDLNEDLEQLLGPEILRDLAAPEQKPAEQQEKPAAAPDASLAEIRKAIQSFYGDHKGSFPKDLNELVPLYLQALPNLRLPDHELTNTVTLVNSSDYDSNLPLAVTESGGWLYFSSTASVNAGMLLIDCSHAAPGGTAWAGY